MSNKQDRQGARTPADLEQKYQFGKKFAELMGIATDARESVDSLASTLRSEMREQETSIIRDTEKIMLTALGNYAKTDELGEVEQTLRSDFTVKTDAITASVAANTKSISDTNKSVSQLNSDLSVERGRITASVADYTQKFEQVGEDIAESESKLRSEITTTAGGISMTVDQHTEQIKKNNETVTGVTDKLRADLDLTSKDMTLGFQGVSERFTDVEGELESVTEELAKYFVFDANGLTIKAGENDMQLRLDNGIISFTKNGRQFGWWDGVNFYTGAIHVELGAQARFGDFAFVPRSNGSLDFLKVGG